MKSRLRKASVAVVAALAVGGSLSVAALAYADAPKSGEAPSEVRELPPRQRSSVKGNPTDDAIKDAFESSIQCMRDAGLDVSQSNIEIQDDGAVTARIQYGYGGSRYDADGASGVEDECKDGYEALLVARGRILDARATEGQ